jgi:hypothetical protein
LRRCLVGMYLLEGGDGDSPEYRLKRLIDGDAGCCVGRPQMKRFCYFTETENEAVLLLYVTKDACPVVCILLPNWMHSPATQLSTRLKLGLRS